MRQLTANLFQVLKGYFLIEIIALIYSAPAWQKGKMQIKSVEKADLNPPKMRNA
jgi:hypothetical protein